MTRPFSRGEFHKWTMGVITAAPSVAVILVNYGGWQDTINCIEALFAAHEPKMSIVIVDNASGDGSLEKITEWTLRNLDCDAFSFSAMEATDFEKAQEPFCDKQIFLVQSGKNLGFAGANNIGLCWAMRAGLDYAWILNNDTLHKAALCTGCSRNVKQTSPLVCADQLFCTCTNRSRFKTWVAVVLVGSKVLGQPSERDVTLTKPSPKEK